MTLDFCIMFVLMVFIVVPENIFFILGLDSENMNNILYVLVWVFVYSLFKFSFKALKSVHKKYLSSRKLTKSLRFSIPKDL